MEYFNLGSYRWKVTTTSAEAQTWFDRGLLWAYSFNHDEALKCFKKATEHDEEFAMAYWGIAYAFGPNYNKSWIRYDKRDLDRAVREATSALERGRLVKNASPLEQALIEAIASRFPPEGSITKTLSSFDNDYVDSMRHTFKEFDDCLDVAFLLVDALMCAHTRTLWDLDTGKPTGPDTIEARTILEDYLARPDGRNHPGALNAADRLRHLVPDGSHMQHMATHIDIACGDYRRAIESNRTAMYSDNDYFASETGSPLYVAYRTHNIHALVYAAMMAGRSEDAIMAAKRLPAILTESLLSVTSPPMTDWAEHQVGLLAHVLIRFGRWEEILQLDLPKNPELMCITTAMILYAKGLALSALGRLDEAEVAQADFEAARRAVPDTRQYGIACRAETVFQVASQMVMGELEYRKENYEEAFAHLREGVRLEDNLPYSDPPVWMQPVRHALGALLLEQGRVKEAEEWYKQDLGLSEGLVRRKARINNVWGLHGLHECFKSSGKHNKAKEIQLQYDIAVATADVPLGASCFCRLSAAKKQAKEQT
ncbi:hypothetical protein HJFPF1_12946 [Paramyrothecium foliicola]|nr:hypothetical protein HJFPF1_12946 [Paramyrothecium foliicola]